MNNKILQSICNGLSIKILWCATEQLCKLSENLIFYFLITLRHCYAVSNDTFNLMLSG